MELLRCEKLSKIYGRGEGRVTALDEIDLSVEGGEFTAVVGASGSGKSTLLHILGTVDKPTGGRVTVEGVDIGKLSLADSAVFRRRKVGLIYQFYNLIPTLTVEKNILLPMLLDKRKPDRDYFDSIVNTLGIRENFKQTIILITHDERIALEADRVITLEDGRIISSERRGQL